MDRYLIVQTSACLAETCTYPIDYIKTQIQLNNLNNIKQTIYKDPLRLYTGLKPSLLRHCIYTTSRIRLYEFIRDNEYTNNRFLIGGLCGGLSQFISSPFDLLKIRYISNTNENKSITNTIISIYKKDNIKGLWKGCIPNIGRAITVNFGELATYEYAKNKIKTDYNIDEGVQLHVLSSMCSGFVSALCCTPFDLVKSKIMQSNTPYRNISHCIYSIVQNEGVLTFYKGFFPIWIRLAPWQLTFWVSYEKLREIYNLTPF